MQYQSKYRAMTLLNEQIEICPRCRSAENVSRKLLLIDRGDPAQAEESSRSWSSDRAFAVTDLRPEFAGPGAVGQFILGLYCEPCGVGFVPEGMAKQPRPSYRLVAGGWQRVNADGTLGPLFARIADDPASGASGIQPSPVAAWAGLDQVEVSRAGHELHERHGLAAHIVASELADVAEAAGDSEPAQFWRAVSSGNKPR
jgi:hypothetical protein